MPRGARGYSMASCGVFFGGEDGPDRGAHRSHRRGRAREAGEARDLGPGAALEDARLDDGAGGGREGGEGVGTFAEPGVEGVDDGLDGLGAPGVGADEVVAIPGRERGGFGEAFAEGGGERGIEDEVAVGGEELELAREGAGEVGLEAGGEGVGGRGDRAEHDGGGLASAGSTCDAEADEPVADGAAKGEELGGGPEEGAEEVGAGVGGVDVVDEAVGEAEAAELGVDGDPDAADDVHEAGFAGAGVGDEGVGEGVAADPEGAAGDGVGELGGEAAFAGDEGGGDDAGAEAEDVEVEVGGVEGALEVAGGGAVVGVDEEAEEVAEVLFAGGEGAPVDGFGGEVEEGWEGWARWERWERWVVGEVIARGASAGRGG